MQVEDDGVARFALCCAERECRHVVGKRSDAARTSVLGTVTLVAGLTLCVRGRSSRAPGSTSDVAGAVEDIASAFDLAGGPIE
jgi:hypothetical protein